MSEIGIEPMTPAPEEDAPLTLDEARRRVAELLRQSKDDPGAPFEMEALRALKVLRDGDRAEYERVRRELQTAKVRTVELDRALKPSAEPEGKEESHAETLIRLAEVAELFHDVAAIDEGYATMEVGHHHESYRIGSKDFKRWLLRQFYEERRVPPDREALQNALLLLEAKAQFDSEGKAVHVRIAGDVNEAIYVDLGDPEWRLVEIRQDGWRLVENCPIKFRRPRGMKPLPEPVRRGSLEDLRPFINVESERDYYLLLAWLVGGFLPAGPYPVLGLHGEQGSSKSTVARVLRRLLDPNTAELRSEPRNVEDLMVAASAGWLLVFDNLSRLPQWLSDALCRLSTGGGFSTRELYTNRDEALFDAMRPPVLTGINVLAESGDLLDRAIIMELAVIEDEDREPERRFWTRFEEKAPGILGAVFTALSGLMKAIPEVKIQSLQRMADFHVAGCALERALGWKEGTFSGVYEENRAEAVGLTLEASPVGRYFLAWMRGREEWTGTATDLLELLVKEVGEAKVSRLKAWPATPKGLSAILRRLSPALRRVGVEVEFDRVGEEGERTIRVSRSPASGCKDASDASVRQGEDAPPDASDASDALFHGLRGGQKGHGPPVSPTSPDPEGLDPDEEVLA